MKSLILLLAVASVAQSKVLQDDTNSAYGYLQNSVARAEMIREAEESFFAQQRIIGGVPAALGQYPHQAGVLIDIVGITDGRGVCGGSLISSNRVISAAHCWFDGVHQGWRVEVVLGSITIFSGGNRQHSAVFLNHPSWFPLLARNDVGIIFLAENVATSNTIAPIALPSGADLESDFTGTSAVASGFGLTTVGGGVSPVLNHIRLNVIANSVCRISFPLVLTDTNICTSGLGTVGTCQGDSGGPLVAESNGRQILIGVTSFGSGAGCEANLPSAYARVTSFVDFINQHI